MKKYKLTSTKFNGCISIGFNDKGVLVLLDMVAASLDAHLTCKFLRSVPFLENNLAASFSSEVTIVEDCFNVSFDEFWTAYDHKINKKRCTPLWDKLDISKKVKAFYGIRQYDAFLKKENRKKCDPENYLRNEMWDNEYKN